MRCPCFIAVRGSLRELAEDASVRPSTAGGWRIEIGSEVAHLLPVGPCAIDGGERDVLCVLVTRGNQFKVFRYLEDREGVLGPFDLSKLPRELEALLIDRSSVRDSEGNILAKGTVRSPYLLAGEACSQADSLCFELGTDPSGALDQVVMAAEALP